MMNHRHRKRIVVGKAKFAGFTPDEGAVSIPLSDIQRVEASKLEVGNTIAV